jgi:hypothetical protein
MGNEMMGKPAVCEACKCGPGVCPCAHHRLFPCLVVILGIVFLLQNLYVISEETTGIVWPILVILMGAAKWFGGCCKCYLKHF